VKFNSYSPEDLYIVAQNFIIHSNMSNFNRAFLNFFENLSKNNTTEWFNEHRKIYEQDVKKPFALFVEELIRRIQFHEPEIQISSSDAIMRINRDIRFSKDKTPYKTHVAANISVYGKKDKSYPGFYFQFSSDSVQIYGGVYMAEKETLQNIRNYIAEHLTEFSMAYNHPLFREKFGNILGEKSSRIPEEFRKAAEAEPLLYNKQFYYGAELKSDILLASDLDEIMMGYYLAGKSVNDLLKNAF
jgi:uncharacterized protein (TIGR02453 family)